jgi:hypothetical protein
LHIAAAWGQTPTCSLLIEKGADMAAETNVSDAGDEYNTATHTSYRMHIHTFKNKYIHLRRGDGCVVWSDSSGYGKAVWED